jgi:hypothetical protein
VGNRVGFNHRLAGWFLLGMPGQGVMKNRIFLFPTARFSFGLFLDLFGPQGDPCHFLEGFFGRGGVQIFNMRERDALAS